MSELQDAYDEIERLKVLGEEYRRTAAVCQLSGCQYPEVDRLTEKCDKQAKILQHVFPEKSGSYFICGDSGSKRESDGLPERVLICPAYGCDHFAVYTREGL